MKKTELIFLALLLVLPTGCQRSGGADASAPSVSGVPKTAQELLEEWPVDDAHDAFLVDTGGRLGTLLATVELHQKDYGQYGLFEVWDPQDMARPIQREVKELDFFGSHQTVDANFDGYGDFGYLYAMGNQPIYYYFWLWDEEAGRFMEEPAFAGISDPVFDQEKQLVAGWARSSGASTGLTTIHRWVDGKLTCIRRIEVEADQSSGFDRVVMSVEDWINGTQVEMFYQTYAFEDGGWCEERSKWEADLDYHGEPGNVYERIFGWLGGGWSHAFTVDTGGSLGAVLVTVERELSGEDSALYVWNMSDLSCPLQTLQAHICQPEDALGRWRCRADANFDGYGDFGYLGAFDGDDGCYYFFWSWNESEKRFEPMEGFEDLRLMWFDPEAKTVYGHMSQYFQWKNGKFTLYEVQD